MSRKFLILLLMILGAILGVFQKEFGLSINPQALVAALIAGVVYLYGEFKVDMERIRKGIFQEGRLKDPKFWTAIVAAIIPILNEQLGWNIPAETITMILTFILGLLFHKETKKAAA